MQCSVTNRTSGHRAVMSSSDVMDHLSLRPRGGAPGKGRRVNTIIGDNAI